MESKTRDAHRLLRVQLPQQLFESLVPSDLSFHVLETFRSVGSISSDEVEGGELSKPSRGGR